MRPNGIFAVIGYALLKINPFIDNIINKFYTGVIRNYWDKENETKQLLSGYDSPQDAKAFLFRAKIQYVLVYLKEQREVMDRLVTIVPLTPIYTDGDIRLYKVEGIHL